MAARSGGPKLKSRLDPDTAPWTKQARAASLPQQPLPFKTSQPWSSRFTTPSLQASPSSLDSQCRTTTPSSQSPPMALLTLGSSRAMAISTWSAHICYASCPVSQLIAIRPSQLETTFRSGSRIPWSDFANMRRRSSFGARPQTLTTPTAFGHQSSTLSTAAGTSTMLPATRESRHPMRLCSTV